ncbi:putative sporulation protein YtxC [Paenibacillus sp. J5C_2022]|uniref:putative sporulation protein YtxC n=1 Tax=Paenibacillus sp. J5C2022 TaxID=2977129 RepID=UPI0021D21015|nr:putative sporulation protein YtxC [Paenibacillus sp. J5C2022]MCU6709862.1 putative sporulation protein YtxC [Paenibacillus sp. J5C2022]
MDLFSVTLQASLHDGVDKLKQQLLTGLIHELHMADGKGAPLVDIHMKSRESIGCSGILPQFRLQEHGPAIFEAAAGIIAEFVISELEPLLLSSIIRKKYSSNPTIESSVIEKYCHDLLFGSEWDGLGKRFHDADRARRKSKIADELHQYLQMDTGLNLKGFLTFRMASYRSELAEIVEYAMDEYVLDKQYQEFISLLKYFVQLQETKIPLVHLLHKGGHDFVMYNESFKLIDPKPQGDRIVAEMLETEMNIEDMVISSLISASPKHINIHTRLPEMGVIRTIETIFDGRVTVCVGCSACSRSLDELIQP